MAQKVLTPDEIIAQQQKMIDQQQKMIGRMFMAQDPLAATVGPLGATVMRGVGKVIGNFTEDPVGSTLKVGLGFAAFSMLAPFLAPAAAFMLTAGVMGLGMKKMVEGFA